MPAGQPPGSQFIAGPPAFVQHLSGQVYRAPLKSDAKPPKRADPDAMEQRIQSKVEEYMAKTDKETRRSKKQSPQSNIDKLNCLNTTMRAALRAGR